MTLPKILTLSGCQNTQVNINLNLLQMSNSYLKLLLSIGLILHKFWHFANVSDHLPKTANHESN